MKSVTGVVYLLHFSAPFGHSSHYCGFTTNLESRLKAHEKGQGARLVQVIIDAGLTFELVRTWEGTRSFERKIKNRKNGPRHCPICSAEKRKQRGCK